MGEDINSGNAFPSQYQTHIMADLSRRKFLENAAKRSAGLAGGLITTCATLSAVKPSNVRAAPCALRPCPPQAWKKQGIVLGPDAAERNGSIQNFTCPAEPLGGDRWRIWSSLSESSSQFNLAWADGAPGNPFSRRVAMLTTGQPADVPFAISHLPKNWRARRSR